MVYVYSTSTRTTSSSQVPLRRKTQLRTSFAESSLVFAHPWYTVRLNKHQVGVSSLFTGHGFSNTPRLHEVCQVSHIHEIHCHFFPSSHTLIAAFLICITYFVVHYAHGVRHDQLSGIRVLGFKHQTTAYNSMYKVRTSHTHIHTRPLLQAHPHRKSPSKTQEVLTLLGLITHQHVFCRSSGPQLEVSVFGRVRRN